MNRKRVNSQKYMFIIELGSNPGGAPKNFFSCWKFIYNYIIYFFNINYSNNSFIINKRRWLVNNK